jgi:hypothetical protein
MSVRSLLGFSTAAIAGVAMLASCPASAFTLPSPSLDRQAPAQVENVFWRGGGWHGGGWHGGWRGRGWGWGPGAVVGGLAAGALVGGYYGGYYGPYSNYGNCWRDGWGRLRCY